MSGSAVLGVGVARWALLRNVSVGRAQDACVAILAGRTGAMNIVVCEAEAGVVPHAAGAGRERGARLRSEGGPRRDTGQLEI